MHIKVTLIAVLLLVTLSACEETLTPPEVTDRFWTAVKNKDNVRLDELVSRESGNPTESGEDLLEIESWKTGKIVIDGKRSEVETVIHIAGENPLKLTINTYLVDEEGDWKVDFPATVAQIRQSGELGLALNRLDEISEQMMEGLDQSIEQFQQAVPVIEQELSKIEEQLREKVPEIRKKLDEFARKLEEALKNKRPPEEKQPIEI